MLGDYPSLLPKSKFDLTDSVIWLSTANVVPEAILYQVVFKIEGVLS